MIAAIQVADALGAVVAGPPCGADARLRLEVEPAASGAVRETLAGGPVGVGARATRPALLADAGATHAEPVAGAIRIGTVHYGQITKGIRLNHRHLSVMMKSTSHLYRKTLQ